MKAIYVNERQGLMDYVYTPKQHDRLRTLAEIDTGKVYTRQELDNPAAEQAEAVFSTWGMPALTREEIDQFLPNVKEVYYAAGSVQLFARPWLEKGVRVFSAWQCNAVPVARFTVGQILLALKGYFRAVQLQISRDSARSMVRHYPGSYEARVGLLGCGAIGSRVAKMLQGMDVEVLVFDPFLPDERAAELQVRKTTMEEIFATCDVISNHLANLPATRHIIKKEHLFSMRPYATFINTGRGAQLDEMELKDALLADPTRTALMDVLDNEAAADANPLLYLRNCIVSPHMAGSSGNEVHRMSESMLDTFAAVRAGEKVACEVTLAQLETMA